MSIEIWNTQADELFRRSPIIPVMVIEHLEDAVPLAKALVAGGLNVLEITLRTSCALKAIEQIIKEVPEAMVGVGTVVNSQQLYQVQELGAKFAISPGASTRLLEVGAQNSIVFIPGVSSCSEVITAMDYGYRHFKFFPAESLGGVNTLKSIVGPLQDVQFCATGGITESNFQSYLALPQVPCIGGSWVAPSKLIQRKDWDGISQICQQALNQL